MVKLESSEKKDNKRVLFYIALLLVVLSISGVIVKAVIPNGWWYNDWFVEKHGNFTISLKTPYLTVDNASINSLYVNDKYFNETEILTYPEQPYSFLMWTDGINYFSKDSHTNEIKNGTNAINLTNNAINKLSLAVGKGGIIHFKNGTYYVTSTINLKGRLTIEGEGVDSTIFKSKNYNGNIFSWSPTSGTEYFLTLRDFKIDGNNTSGTGWGVYITSSGGSASDTVIENLFIIHCKGGGIYANTGTWGLRIRDNIIESNAGKAISISGGGQSYIQNNFFAYNGANYAVEINAGASYGIFTGNNIYHNSYTGMLLQSRFIVSDNYFVANDYLMAGYYQLYLGGSADYSLIENNYFYADSKPKGAITIASGSNNHLIQNNYIDDTHDAGFFITDIGTGNIIRGNTGYITENSGNSSFTIGVSTKAVTHGLSFTPISGQIMITPTSGLGNCTSYAITAYSSTTFTTTLYDSTGTPKGSNIAVSFGWIGMRSP